MVMQLTQPANAVSQEEINAFRMPRTRSGDVVEFYPDGCKSGSKSQIAFVVACYERTASLYLPLSGLRRDAVRHLGDPKLKMNDHQRENGAWDFSESQKHSEAERQELLGRVARLEQKIAALTIDQARGGKESAKDKEAERKPSGFEQMNMLRAEAKELGLEIDPSWKKPDLEAAIELRKEELAPNNG